MLIQTKFAFFGRAIRQTYLSNTYPRKLILSTRTMSSSACDDDVLFEEYNNKGIITLNRPKALNSLNMSMVKKILPKLQRWEVEKSMVIIKGAGDKAFCAGGDVREATLLAKNKDPAAKAFFKNEYSMNHLIGTYKVPYIALIDGITMGGGVGISVHGWYVVATEKTLFAMPETQIGLFPDVGGTYKLPRLENNIGFYLALTGARLKGYELVQAGMATHYCLSARIPELEKALLTCCDPEAVLCHYCTTPENAVFSLEPYLSKINYIFRADSVECLFSRLRVDGSEWSCNTIATLGKMCPLSLKITLEALRRGKTMSLGDCLRMEYRMASVSCDGHNFIEGVRALLIDKDQNPKWIPKCLPDITDEMVDAFFDTKPSTGDLEPRPPGQCRDLSDNASQERSKL